MNLETGISQARKLAGEMREHLFGHILPFWCGPAVDREQGGWMGWLGNDLTPDRTKPKGLIVHSRILWTFSAVHQVAPQPLFREMADRAFDYLMTRFWDRQHGGGFWQLDDRGVVRSDEKKIYGQAFLIYAFCEYYRAFQMPAALDYARKIFDLIERHAFDRTHGGYIEVCRADWSEAGPEARLSDKDMSEKKSMNNHLHVLEAYTNLCRVWRQPGVERRLRDLLGLFEHRILDPQTGHLHHFFNEEWVRRSDTYTFGHDIEASWLLCEAADVLGDEGLQRHIRELALRMAEVVLVEGASKDGGLCYEGRAGQVIDAGKEGWPQAEAIVGFVNAWQLSGKEAFLEAAVEVWRFVQRNLVDRVHGEWFWRINADGMPDGTLPKVSEWKGPYHGSRACLECGSRFAG